MGNGRGKLDIPYLAIFSVILLGAVAVSLYFFPEWRESPATMVVLVVAAIGGVVGLAANFRSAFIRDRADTPPAPLDYDSPQHRRNQENVTANVRSAWIDGVLRESLPERVRLELALDHPPGKLQRTIIPVEGQEPRREPASAGDIADIFRASGRALLILGAPGSGKTVTLLELCRTVLEGVEADPRRPVPVVLNLSTWAQKQAPLEAWIADEMWRQYGLNRQVTPGWLAADHLILLLDGLDEVAAEARDACARAINAFRESHGAGMAVCSRSADYVELRERLALSNAVEIQPLTPAQIEDYLRDERLALDGVREAIARDDALRELATTPLMLNVMALAYGGRSLAELLPLLDSKDERRAHLYDAYIARMFRRKPLAGVNYTAGQALRWLRYLARRLTRRNETQFFIEDLQFSWVYAENRFYFLWYFIFCGSLGGILGGIIVPIVILLSGVDSGMGILFQILIGIFFGGFLFLLIPTPYIEPVDKLDIDISQRNVRKALKIPAQNGLYGLILGILIVGSFFVWYELFGMIVGLLYSLSSSTLNVKMLSILTSALGSVLLGFILGFGMAVLQLVVHSEKSPQIIRQNMLKEFRESFFLISLIGLLFTIGVTLFGWHDKADEFINRVYNEPFDLYLFGLTIMSFTLFFVISLFDTLNMIVKTVQTKQRFYPNHGIRQSVKNALRVALGLALGLGVIGAILGGVLGKNLKISDPDLQTVVVYGILSGTFIGFSIGITSYGGFQVLRHYLLRVFMQITRLLPLRLVPFLEAMRERILLQRAGAHYRFIHRTLQEHVAALSDERIAAIVQERRS
jgi:hypothetical protein